jgi:hypothetical protein
MPIIAAGVGIAVVLVAFVFLQSGGKAYACDSLLQPDPAQTADPNALGFVTPDLGTTHVTPGARISYDYCPPASGGHWNAAGRGPIRSAVYGPANEQPPGAWVHNLEHGAIVVLYRCPTAALGSGDCATAAEMAQMQSWWDSAPVVNNCPKQAVVARFDEMATRFAVLSWNRALLVDTFDLEQASVFAEQWTDQTAPEAERLVCS